ncbi:transglycosylase SLT domain-containing protein [Rahnella bonaserana]
MAKLPDVNDLGRRTPQMSRGVASADLSAPGRAMEGLGKVIEGTASNIGNQIDKFNYAEAQSAFLKKKMSILSSFENDNDYSTFGDRYNSQIDQAKQDAMGMLRNNNDRRSFDIDAGNDVARGFEQINGLAKRKEADHGVAVLNDTIQSNRDAALTAPDEQTRMGFISATKNAIAGAHARGYIDETSAQRLDQKAQEDYASSSISMMTPDKQIAALSSGSGLASLIPPDTRKKMIDAAASNVISNRISDAQLRLMNPAGMTGFTAGPIPSDDLFSAVISQESGGRQFAPDGSPLSSAKGALGVAQVMPATAPEAAALAGVPWDEAKYKSDAQYNASLGKAYLNQQLKKYNGNPVLALAAYNAGPGKVDEWIKQIGDPRTGEVSSEQFANSIPFGETQNYVASVMSNAAKINVTKNVVNSPEFQMLDGAQKARAVEQTYNVIDTATSSQRFDLKNRMQDDAARINAGEVVNNPITPAEFSASMPLSSTPAQRAQDYQQYSQYKQLLSLQPAFQTIISSPAPLGLEAVNAMRPSANDADFDFKQKRYTKAAQKYQQVISAREKDPGGWMIQNMPDVQSAYQAYQQDPAQGAQLVHQVLMQKQRLGIKNKDVLPDTLADGILQQISNNKESDVSAIQSVGQQFGPYSQQVMQQVQKKAGPVLQVVMATSNPRAANALWQNRDVTTANLKDAVNSASSGAADSADNQWASQSKDFAATMVGQPGGIPVWNNFNEQGRRLTYLNMQRGMGASDAAAQAYQDILGSQYQTKGTWRVPVASNVDIKDVSDGVDTLMSNLKPTDITPLMGDPRLSADVNRQQSLDRIKDSGEWVTNADETGLMLTLNGLVVNDAEGNPLTVSFNDLSQLGSNNRGFFNQLGKTATKPRMYTPGEATRASEERNAEIVDQLGNRPVVGGPSMAEGMRNTNANLYQRSGSGDQPANN